MTDFSDETDSEQAATECNSPIIPIFPLRFALTADSLLAMAKSWTPSPTPQSIDDMPRHELVRIRRGFIYVYANDILQAFRFETREDDENGTVYNRDAKPSSAPVYSFTKYRSTRTDDDTSVGWEATTERYPYAFVPKDTPKAWVAYSEAHWPYRMQYQVEQDAGFRGKVMTEIDLTSRSGPFCAPITELAQRVPTFRKGSTEYPAPDLERANALRVTSVVLESTDTILASTCTREFGVMVALHDPIGELQDIQGLQTVCTKTAAQFATTNQYPLIIGNIARALQQGGEVSTSHWSYVFDGALNPEFDAAYQRLMDDMDVLTMMKQRAAEQWAIKMGEEGRGTLMDLMANCFTLAEKFSLRAHMVNHSEIIAYMTSLYARANSVSAGSPELQERTNMLFAPELTDAVTMGPLAKPSSFFTLLMEYVLAIMGVGGTSQTMLDGVRNAGTAAKGGIDGFAALHSSFKPALSAFFTVYGTEIVSASTGIGVNATSRLTAVMFTRTTSFRTRDELSGVFRRMLAAEGYPGQRLPAAVDAIGDSVSGSQRLGGDAADSGRIGVVEFHAQIDMRLDSEYLAHARKGNNFDFASNGFGFVLAGLSLQSTIATMNDPRHNLSVAGTIGESTTANVIAAFADAYSSSYGLSRAVLQRSSSGATRAVARELFGNRALLQASTVTNATSRLEAAIASKSMQASARAAGMVGVAISGFKAYEGVTRGDGNMAIGNGLMCIGGAALLFVTGPLALVAAALLILGLGISLLSDSRRQRWVREGFWGSSTQYWGARRLKTIPQLESARALGDTGNPGHAQMKTFYEEELARYLDSTAELTIVDGAPRDGKIEIHCQTLQQVSDLARLQVTVSYDLPGVMSGDGSVAGLQISLKGPGVASVTIPAGNYDSSDGNFEIEATLSRIPNGSFEESKTLMGSQIW